MISNVWSFFESYGWFVTIGAVLSYFVYRAYIAPKLSELHKSEELIQRKKYDEDVHTKEAERLAAARERQQKAHDVVSAQMKEKEEEARQQKLEELRKAVEKESVLKYALNTPPKQAKAKETPGEIIDRYISSKPLVIFSKTTCPFCRKAKSVLATFRLNSKHFTYVELDERDDLPGELIQQEFIKRYGSRSVPKVFIGGELIGGGDDTVALFQQGVLEDLVKAAIDSFEKK